MPLPPININASPSASKLPSSNGLNQQFLALSKAWTLPEKMRCAADIISSKSSTLTHDRQELLNSTVQDVLKSPQLQFFSDLPCLDVLNKFGTENKLEMQALKQSRSEVQGGFNTVKEHSGTRRTTMSGDTFHDPNRVPAEYVALNEHEIYSSSVYEAPAKAVITDARQAREALRDTLRSPNHDPQKTEYVLLKIGESTFLIFSPPRDSTPPHGAFEFQPFSRTDDNGKTLKRGVFAIPYDQTTDAQTAIDIALRLPEKNDAKETVEPTTGPIYETPSKLLSAGYKQARAELRANLNEPNHDPNKTEFVLSQIGGKTFIIFSTPRDQEGARPSKALELAPFEKKDDQGKVIVTRGVFAIPYDQSQDAVDSIKASYK